MNNGICNHQFTEFICKKYIDDTEYPEVDIIHKCENCSAERHELYQLIEEWIENDPNDVMDD